jgi:DHA1 family bicyclomycin/chloramphenicol resistance-like MFS transporter
MPMATALAMNDHPERAGSASGLLGFAQFTLGSAVVPLVGIAGAGTALPMAITMATCAIAGIALRAAIRPRAAQPV